MGEVAHATTDASGRYSLDRARQQPLSGARHPPGRRLLHRRAQGGAPGDIPVYDVAAKVQGVFIEADVIEVETDNGQLKVDERYFVHNTSSPPTTQWSKQSFEIVLPADAVLNDVGAQRPTGLPTSRQARSRRPQGPLRLQLPHPARRRRQEHPLPDQLQPALRSGKYTFKSQVSLPAENLAVLMPKSMTFTAGSGAAFKSVQEDPGIQTWLLRTRFPARPSSSPSPAPATCPAKRRRARPGRQAAQVKARPGRSARRRHRNPHRHSRSAVQIQMVDPRRPRLLLAAAAAFLLRKPATAVAERLSGMVCFRYGGSKFP